MSSHGIQEDSHVGDIEQNISDHSDSGSSQAAASRHHASEIHGTAVEAAGSPSTATSQLRSMLFVVKYVGFCIVSMAIYFPLFQVSMLAFYCSSSGKLLGPEWCSGRRDKTPRRPHRRAKGIYHKMNEFETPKNKLRQIVIVTAARLGCLVSLWLVNNLCVPGLRRALLFGSLLWKWSLLATLLSLGYPCTYSTVNFFRMTFVDGLITKAHDGYYLVWGLVNDTLASMLYFAWVLLAWVIYFRTERGLNVDSRDQTDKYITWTLASFLIGATLWVVKRVVVLQWTANSIHKRFKARILMAGFQLFFLSAIVDGLQLRALLPCWFGDDEQTLMEAYCKDGKRRSDQKDKNARMITKRINILDYMLTTHVSLQQINEITGYVADLAEVALRESNNVSEIIETYQHKFGANNVSGEYVTEENIRNWLTNDEAELLIAVLLTEFPNKKINEVQFLKWIVAAHKNCVALGYTLIDAYAVVRVLDMILTCCIVVTVAMVWLLVTELATTKVLIVIASPFLASTLVFGDTCKTFFQGVIFSFVTHPFDVGDRCIIDGVEVEIKRISILTTTCIKIGTEEKMLYPNSEIATKLIVNLESKHEAADVIELALDPFTSKSQILRLRRCIRNFISSNNQHDFYEKSCRVMVKEIGNSIKMSIHFKHTMNVQDLSHSEFFQKKKRQRSKLFIKIKQFLEDLNIKVAKS